MEINEPASDTPNSSRKLKRLTIALIVVVLIAIGVAVFARQYTETPKSASSSAKQSSTAQSSGQSSTAQSIDFSGKEIQLDNLYAGPITVQQGQAGRVTVTHSGGGQIEVTHHTDGSTLVLDQQGSCKNDGCPSGFTISVPPSIKISGSRPSAPITLRNIDNTISLTTAAKLTADNLTAGDVVLHSSNGGVSGQNLHAKHVSATSSNGPVSIAFAVAPEQVQAQSDNDNVTVRLTKDKTVYKLTMRSDNGKTSGRIQTDDSSKNTIDAQSQNGDVDVAYL